MPIKIFSAVVAILLFFAYLMPVVFKLKEISLGLVILIGTVMMLTDLFQSFKRKD